MTAKEYLNRAYKLDHRINSKLDQLQSLNDLTQRITTSLSEVPPSGTRNVHRLSDTIDKIIDLENEINEDIDMLVDIKREIMSVIKSVDNIECQLLLEKRYLCFNTWEQIAVDLDYCIDNVYKLHRRALSLVKINS